jgi:hypothetical protein
MNDLFEYPELWPANLRAILARYMAKEQTYTNLIRLENDLFKIGYSIEYGLDCVAYNLQKIDKWESNTFLFIQLKRSKIGRFL